jgi:para-aminobenzoate synthetase/4-amino-4-deoxychorismate lyase
VHNDGFEFIFSGRDPQHFARPAALFTAYDRATAWGILQEVDRLRAQGFAVAGWISYELGYSCVGLSEPRSERPALPYVALGAFHPGESRRSRAPQLQEAAFSLTTPAARLSYAEYAAALTHIAEELHRGNVYQVNYTLPFDFTFIGDPAAGFTALTARTRAPYAAFVRLGDAALVSLSPELFLRFTGKRLTTKPMKGTASLDAIGELRSPKNRAEHLMIVDLLRNDLAIVSDRTCVERIFEEEIHPTFATLTSTISGDLRAGTPFDAIIRALFPCGSVTGAPKRSAMATIARTERWAREVYCGTIGYLLPNGEGEWNVAIRTLQLDSVSGRGRLDLGGGIVADSRAADEWRELEIKGRFLQHGKDSPQ